VSSDRDNEILGVVERWWASRYSERHALVTSYDPKLHLAKVTFQPEGQESGWLPIETGHIGNGYGIATGLTPGDGQSTGDQVVVRYQEGDFESGKIVQRVHSDEEKPPTVQSGETVIWNKFQKSGGGKNSATGGQGGTGQQLYFKNDGSATLTDGNGATWLFDGAGNATLTCKNLTVKASGNRSIAVGGADTVNIGGDKAVSIGGKRVDTVGGLWNAIAKFGIWAWLMDDDG
jgi:uncharacterized protein involved in type VI secretion and phage assembly